jgi:hypothetical protein
MNANHNAHSFISEYFCSVNPSKSSAREAVDKKVYANHRNRDEITHQNVEIVFILAYIIKK